MNMLNLIGKILVSAIRNLFANQPDVLTPTSFTGMTEWNFGHHLANEIIQYIFWLNHDLDVTKHNYDNRRPDIIFHKRGINDLNFLVVEIKTKGSSGKDIKKIRDGWVCHPLEYRFGASIVVQSTDDFEVNVFQKNRSQTFSKSISVIPIPKMSDSDRILFIELVDKITLITKDEDYLQNPQKQAKVKALEREIDRIVNELYGLTEDEIAVVEENVGNV